MYYKLMSLKLDLTINLNYYQENKFGVDLVKAHVNIIDSPLIVIYMDQKIIRSRIVHLLYRM
jgi:hypothetical protein